MGYGYFRFLAACIVTLMLMLQVGAPLLERHPVIFTVLLLFCFWGGQYWFLRWSLYERSATGMSDRALREILSDWTKSGPFQKKSEIYIVQRTKDENKIVSGYKRILELQKEVHRRNKFRLDTIPSSEITDIERAIAETEQAIKTYSCANRVVNLHPNVAESVLKSQQATTQTTANGDNSSSINGDTQQAPNAHEPASVHGSPKNKKTPTKSLFISSFKLYLEASGVSKSVQVVLIHMIRHPKEIEQSPDSRKRALARYLELYMESASDSAINEFGPLYWRLMGLTQSTSESFE